MSSKRNLRRRKCERKVKFGSREEAEMHSERIQRQGGDFLKAYRCEHCHRFHLGHERGTRQEHRSVSVAAAF